MKAVIPFALVGALAFGATALAADNSAMSGSSSNQSSSGQQHWNKGQVRQLQGQLKQQGYDVGKVDGLLGPTTQQALRQFQEDKGIQATGQPDQQTVAALQQTGGTQQGQMPSSSGRNPPASSTPDNSDTSGQNSGANHMSQPPSGSGQ